MGNPLMQIFQQMGGMGNMGGGRGLPNFPGMMPQGNPMMPQNMGSPQGNNPINPDQFKQFIPNLDESILKELVNKAKGQGVSDQEIADGMNFIKSLMNK